MEEADWRKWFMCTCITCENGAFDFGRNLDLDVSFGEHVVITPRRFPLRFTRLPVLKEHYAMIGMAAAPEKFPLYAEAVNEKGLCMAGLNFPDNAVYRKEEAGMFNAASFEMIPWILGSCGSVEEAAELLENTCVTDAAFSAGLPGDASSVSRFIRAAFLKWNSVSGSTEEENVSQFFHILDGVSMVRGSVVTPRGTWDITTYSCCVNAGRGIYYYKTYEDSRIRRIDMRENDLSGDSLITEIDRKVSF